jgi:hypothetical protein
MSGPESKPKIPDEIWLQWYGEDDETEGPPHIDEDITWCWEKINNNDIRYIRDKRYGKKKDRTETVGQ